MKKNKITKQILIQLGMANLFGWIAYTIYDNFFDDESDIKTLSLANVSLREAIKLFSNILPANKKYQVFFHHIFDQIDSANYWEITSCRNKKILPTYKNYNKLAEKSFGHALGPLAILFILGYNEKSQEIKHLCKFFKHYLIAKQLNDDAHDWEKDLKMQIINPVTVLILQKIPTRSSFKKYKQIFWEEIIDVVCIRILHHVKKGKKALSNCSFIDTSFFETMIIEYEQIAIKTLEEKKQTMKFVQTYSHE